ncbi:MAG: twin-arginine translocation pathway signal protein [Pseudomonadota bacterium]
MSLSRRKLLALAGGGVIVAATAAGTGFALTRTPSRALAPWEMAGTYTEKRRRALSWAILAPNPHNQQPWIVDLPGEDDIAVSLDTSRLLPATDPLNRQITIGLGCFLELMVQAAAQDGHSCEIVLFPQGEAAALAGAAPVFTARMGPGGTPDPLFAHALQRRSTKEPFDMSRPVTAAEVSGLTEALSAGALSGVRADGTADPAQVASLRALGWEAFQIEMNTPSTYLESVDVMRLGKAEINANPDGIDLGGPFLESLMLAGLLTHENLRDIGGQSWQSGVDMYAPIFENTPAFIWLATPGNSRPDQIAAGRDWLRLNLATTAAGMALHPVSQALQEYPEMAAPYAQAHALLAQPGETVQMLGRLGYAEPVSKTPRWPIEAKLRG